AGRRGRLRAPAGLRPRRLRPAGRRRRTGRPHPRRRPAAVTRGGPAMSAIAPASPPVGTVLPGVPARRVYRLSVAQYHAMIGAGILKDGDPVELLEGVLVRKMTKNPPHRVATRHVRRALEAAVPPGWSVDSQEPITLDTSEPEPDAVVAILDA